MATHLGLAAGAVEEDEEGADVDDGRQLEDLGPLRDGLLGKEQPWFDTSQVDPHFRIIIVDPSKTPTSRGRLEFSTFPWC